MNRQGDKGIGWTEWTWNPVTGCKSTSEQCAVRDVCYARRISKRIGQAFYPRFHPERLEEPYKLKKPSKIFVCSMGELFGPWVPREWQEAVIKVARENPQHIFQFLTKFPEGYPTFEWPENCWLGVTITSDADAGKIESLHQVTDDVIRFVSAEPLLGYLSYHWLYGIDWLIIGAQTNPPKQPEKWWVRYLQGYGIAPVFMKSNLDYEPKRREFPRGGGDE